MFPVLRRLRSHREGLMGKLNHTVDSGLLPTWQPKGTQIQQVGGLIQEWAMVLVLLPSGHLCREKCKSVSFSIEVQVGLFS